MQFVGGCGYGFDMVLLSPLQPKSIYIMLIFMQLVGRGRVQVVGLVVRDEASFQDPADDTQAMSRRMFVVQNTAVSE